MRQKNSTRKALLSSAISLVLCLAMLIGTTFAWFTDSVTSTGNIIKSGKLDVEMYWANGTEEPADATWKDASRDAIFNYDLWEPGYVEVRHIKIANVGSLALQYQLAIVANGEVSELADVIDVYFVDPAIQVSNRAALEGVEPEGTLTEVLAGMPENARGSLLAEDGKNEAIVTIALKMQESAGNEYQEKSIGTDFSVVLTATQFNAESDSFDENYDANLVPPTLDGDIMQEVDGIIYAYNDGETRLFEVPEDYAGDTVEVMEGTEVIGNYAFSNNDNVKKVVLPSSVTSLGRGFDTSNVETVVLNEGLEQIDSRAFRSTPELKEVVIPASVKVIEDNAFQKSGIKTLTIPATVETVGETAFGASLIETVIFEGNTSIQGYAFRGCTKLREVYLNGDDNEFIKSTLNGRNSCWFCNGESNNPNTSNITFYVKNDEMAIRVSKAMGAESDNTPIILNGQSVKVKAVANATKFQEALNNASSDTIIYFSSDISGNVKATQKAGVDVLVNGQGKKFTGVMTVFGAGEQDRAETYTVKNVNFVAVDGADSCIVSPDRTKNNQYSYAHNVTVENCTFTDPSGDLDCAAIRHEDGGDKNWVLKNCKVDNTMHSLMQVNNVVGKLTIQDCTVESKNGVNLNSSTNVEITGCTFDVLGYAVRLGVKTGGNFGEAKNYVISNCTLKSANGDGDAVIVIRASAADVVMTLNNTTLVGNPQISGATADTTINQ